MTVHAIRTAKFKTVTLSLQFRAPLKMADATKRALLAYVLKSATAKSPTTQALQQRLDNLYGAAFSSQVQKKGNDHILSLFVHTANERFLSQTSSLTEECVKLLAEAVFEPNAKAGAFDEQMVKKEKRTLKHRIESLIDDKMRYASERLIDVMCKDEAYAIHSLGYTDDLEALSPKDLFVYYQNTLQNDEIDLYVIGDIVEDEIVRLIEQHFTFQNRQQVHHPFTFHPVAAGDPQIVKERHDVEQGKLNLGYRTNIVVGDPLYYATQVFNGIFGGFAHSKLFMNVREKASLAYYAASRYESYKGLLIVMSGIEFSNYDKAVDIIGVQLKSMQDGDFTTAEVDQTKALLKNTMLESLDNPYTLVDLLYKQVLVKDSDTLEEWFQGIDQVSHEEIVKAAQNTELDTVYFLQGLEG